ncbi:pilus assembly protein N-terminal domain-containing protein [Gammaproteobacteria bacterium]|nr:pilus assembly protein N-terminal domain-containing protein [Gammaproteobacteria bacterium]
MQATKNRLRKKFVFAMKTLLICALAVGQSLAVAAPAAEKLFSLYVGESVVWDVGDVERVVLGDGDVVSTRMLSSGEMVIVADAEGNTNIHLWGKSGWRSEATVHVLTAKANRTTADLNALLRNVTGISVNTVAGRAVVEGNIFASDEDILETVLALYPGTVNLTKVSNAFSEKMIYLNLQLVEFSTNDLENLGIDWGSSMAGPTAALFRAGNTNSSYRPDAPSDFSGKLDDVPFNEQGSLSYFGIATQINSRINYLVTTGRAFQLASPRLSARSGGEAEFLAGGQVPVVTSNINGTTISYKDFGISLQIAPVADDNGNITARVATEVSSLDQANAVAGVPGFKTRATSTDVTMKDGETLVISGLMNSEMNLSEDQVKWLGDIPILGKFFQNGFDQGSKTELVIFITPSVIDSKHDINLQETARRDGMIQKMNEAFEKGLVE